MLGASRDALAALRSALDAQLTAAADPAGFLEGLPPVVTLDEVQRVPELLRAIKVSVDRDRRPGRFLLTGSANLLLLPHLSDSLAGRMEVIHLHPLTEAEKERAPGLFLELFLAGTMKPEIRPEIAASMALVRASPGKVTYASSGSGTSIHMSAEMFKHLTGTDIVHVPYKGSAPALTDLLGGQVQMMFDNIPSALPHIKAGKLRALATTGARRDPALPDLPTVAEAGVPGYEAGVWFGLAVPAGTPADVVARLNAEAVKATRSPDFVRRMSELGYLILGTSAEQMASMQRAEQARWAPVVKSSGATAD